MANVAADLLVHVGADTKDAESGLSRVGSSVDKAGQGFSKSSLIMAGGAAAIVGGLGASVMMAANYEQSIANITALGGEWADSQKEISSLALQIGKDTSFSATEGAAAIGELAKAGVPVQDVLNGAAMSAAQLAEAGGTSIPEAATIMSNSMNMFSLSGKDAAQVADIFAAAANASASDVSSLAQGLAQGGPAAASFGISLKDTATALALFSNYGIQGSDAGTSLKTMLQRLAAPTDEAAQKMQELGINAFDSSGKFVGLENLSGQLNTALSGMSDEAKNAALSLIFGADASRVASIMAKEGAKGFNDMGKQVGKSGVAAEMSRKRMNTLNGSIEQLKGSVETAMIVVGSAFVPVIRALSDGIGGLVNWFLNLNPQVQKIASYAIAAVGAVLGLGAAITGAGAALSIAAGFAAALLSPIGALIAIGAALYLAWSTNFLGIRDILTGVFESIMGIVDKFITYFQVVADTGRVVNMTLLGIPEPLRNIAVVMGVVVDGILDFINVLTGGGGLGEAWAALTDRFTTDTFLERLRGIPGDLLGIFTSIDWAGIGNTIWNGLVEAAGFVKDITAEIVPKLGNLTMAIASWVWEKASQVDWGGLLKSAASLAGDITGEIVAGLGNLTMAIASWVWEKASAVDWGGLLSSAANLAGDITGSIVAKLGDLTQSLSTWVATQAGAVDWAGKLSAAAGMAGDITGTIVSKLGNLAAALGSWITTGAASLPWSSIASGATNITSDVISKIGDLGQSLKTWYDNAINSVDWGNLGVTVGEKVGNLAEVLGPKALELITGFTTWLQNNWQTVGTVLLGLILGLPATIGYIGLTLGPKALEFLQGFVQGLDINWSLIGNWLSGLPAKLLAAVPGLLATLGPKALELLQSFVTGLDQNWPTVTFWLGQIGTKAVTGIGSLLSYLGPKALELLQGLVTGLDTNWPTVVTWLGQLGTKALAAVPVVTDALIHKGEDLLTGVFNGLEQKWPQVSTYLGELGTKALAAVPDLAESLLDKGVELITGIFTGLENEWPTVSDWLGQRGTEAFNAVGSLLQSLPQRGTELIQGLSTAATQAWDSKIVPAMRNIGPGAFALVGSLGSTLLSRGTELIQGLSDGITSKWRDVVGQLQGIKQGAIDSVGDLSGALWNAGWSLIDGFRRGIEDAKEAAIGAAQSIVDTVTGILSNVPGFSPIEHVGLFYGEKLSFSFAEGIASAIREAERNTEKLVNSSLNQFGQTVDATRSARMVQAAQNIQGGNTVIYQTNQFDVHVDELEDVVEAARFVRDIDSSRTLYFAA